MEEIVATLTVGVTVDQQFRKRLNSIRRNRGKGLPPLSLVSQCTLCSGHTSPTTRPDRKLEPAEQVISHLVSHVIAGTFPITSTSSGYESQRKSMSTETAASKAPG